jgi:hypothetical protein
MNKFRICFQYGSKNIFLKLFFSVGNGANTAARYWQLRDDGGRTDFSENLRASLFKVTVA